MRWFVQWFEDDQHIRIYERATGLLCAVCYSWDQAEEAIDLLEC